REAALVFSQKQTGPEPSFGAGVLRVPELLLRLLRGRILRRRVRRRRLSRRRGALCLRNRRRLNRRLVLRLFVLVPVAQPRLLSGVRGRFLLLLGCVPIQAQGCRLRLPVRHFRGIRRQLRRLRRVAHPLGIVLLPLVLVNPRPVAEPRLSLLRRLLFQRIVRTGGLRHLCSRARILGLCGRRGWKRLRRRLAIADLLPLTRLHRRLFLLAVVLGCIRILSRRRLFIAWHRSLRAEVRRL